MQLYEVRFSDIRCAEERTSDLSDIAAQAIRLALHDCGPLVILAEAAYERAYVDLEQSPPPPADAADGFVHAAFWADPHLGPTTLSRAKQRLEEHGLECTDCPVAPAVERESMTWAEFERYISAYIWPAQVSETDEIQVYICSANNGVEELGLSGTARLNAAFLAAVALASDDLTRDVLAHLAKQDMSLAVARSAVAQLIASDDARRVICKSVEAHAWYTGVIVDAC
jgi:hypothetical protein